MRLVSLGFALALAASASTMLRAQEGGLGQPGTQAAPKAIEVAAKTAVKKKVKKKVAQPSGPPAKQLFGAAKGPAAMAARSIGFYAKGCLAGAAALPIDGVAWQAMRLSRNRNWGHPELVALVEKLAVEARQHDGWPGLLVGDLSQPRGGPMLTGHASHQVGLDADIWLTPMPDRRLSEKEREDLSATSMLADDKVSVDPKIWTDAHVRLIKRAASLCERRADLRASRHQEGAVRGHPRRCQPRLAAQGARLLGPLLPFPRAHRLPEGQRELRSAAAAAERRRLRQGAHQLAGSRETEAAGTDPAANAAFRQARGRGHAQAWAHPRSAAGGVPRSAVERAGRGANSGASGKSARSAGQDARARQQDGHRQERRDHQVMARGSAEGVYASALTPTPTGQLRPVPPSPQ